MGPGRKPRRPVFSQRGSVVETCEENDLSNTILVIKVKVELLHKIAEKSYNKSVIDFNFRKHKDLSTLLFQNRYSPRHCGLGEYN